jgi:hypothetical protein
MHTIIQIHLSLKILIHQLRSAVPAVTVIPEEKPPVFVNEQMHYILSLIVSLRNNSSTIYIYI